MRPVFPQPGYTETDVREVAESRQSVFMDCYTIQPLIGSALRYCTAQGRQSVVPNGEVSRQTYTTEVLITGLRMSNKMGVEVDQKQLQVDYPEGLIYQSALSWPQALLQGRLDGATVKRDRYFAWTWGNSFAGATKWVGGTPMFLGLMSTVDRVGRQTATMNVKSDLVLLNRQAPAYLWEANCKNTWGDTACGVDQDVWAVHSTVDSGTTRSVIQWASASTDYNLGKIHISNGDSVTRVRTISRATTGELFLAYPLDFDPVAGMAFTAYPGCSRTKDPTTGCPKYHGVDWQKKFKGAPFIPVAETGI